MDNITIQHRFKVAVCVPLYNGGQKWREATDVLSKVCSNVARCLAVDSGSKDSTAKQAAESGFEVITIAQSDFNHGGTRNMMFESVCDDVDIVIFSTQDAIIESANTVATLVATFNDPDVGVAYARQLPHKDSGHIGSHARLFNYPASSRVVSKDNIPELGIKAAFVSNSFAAYRVDALEQVDGFPDNVILAEDMYTAAKMILDGWKVAYAADSKVYHSHDYTMLEEFRRYFDTGVFHEKESWLLDRFGSPEGEGGRFVKSELTYLWRHSAWLIPEALVRTVVKYTGYKLGRSEKYLPHVFKRFFSMHKRYWHENDTNTGKKNEN